MQWRLWFFRQIRGNMPVSINVAILFLSFKRAITVPNKLINSQHYKRHRRKIRIAFLSLSNLTLTNMQLNLSFLKTLNDSETGTTFPQPSLIWFKRDKNKANLLFYRLKSCNFDLNRLCPRTTRILSNFIDLMTLDSKRKLRNRRLWNHS